jgi:phosphatidate cytidylyltransferase
MSVQQLQNKLSNLSSLTQRVLTALVLAPVALGILYFGGLPFIALLVAVALRGYHEWVCIVYRSAVKLWPVSLEYTACATLAAALLLAAFTTYQLGLVVLILGAIIVAIIGHLYIDKGPRDAPPMSFVGIFYLGLPALALLWLRQRGAVLTPQADWAPLMIVMLQVWATDIFAYFAGRAFGGPKLAPSISPKKTWSGLIGGAVASSLVTGGLAMWVDMPQAIWFFGLGFVLALVAQAGDLFESHLKRKAGFKDSGNLLPGHGGVLDRVDGLLAAAPVFMLVCYWLI